MPVRLRSLLALSLSLFAAPAIAAPAPVSRWQDVPASRVIVLAHRGCWSAAPEVSIAAIEACAALGVDAVEIDVRRSRDGALVLMHDETVDRTTDGKGAVAAMTAKEVARLRLRTGSGGPDAPLTDQHVPTLEQALKVAKGKVLVNVHLKADVAADVARLVRRLKMEGAVSTWVTAGPTDPALTRSPLLGAVSIIPTINDCTIGYPAPCWPNEIDDLRDFAPAKPLAYFLDFRQTHDFIAGTARVPRPAGSRIFVETLNTEGRLSDDERNAEWRWLIDNGVSIIMTDRPLELLSIRAER